ncbi:putative bolA-like protein C4B3.11c [Grifola frondosa]|uniref:Putative bolA-like protein C4B3.11c n=1 Tax=Grifola frondosa TaxID=5627 RepID=A0A1C7M463_GRIFR|nr:putative bolA-like protein C4B3.11c [Grifola frondosa]
MLSLTLVRRIAGARFAGITSVRRYVAPPPGLSEGERTIFNKLTEKFSPAELTVQDVSGGCGTFYHIVISSESFKGLTMVKQHRLVNDTLKKEIEGIHGLQLKTTTPSS